MKIEIKDLRACPFCGTQPSSWIHDHDDRSLELIIDCGMCGARMTSYLAHGSKEPPSQLKANALCDEWNTRTTDKLQKQFDALVKYLSQSSDHSADYILESEGLK